MKTTRRYYLRTLIFLGIGATLWVFNAQLGAASMGLTGVVSSEKEARMEGVIVSAQKIGGTITVSVVSDAQGRYAFPSDRLQPGKYRLKIRAAGFDLDDPGEIELAANHAQKVDLKLQVTHDLSKQLTSAEFLMSAPGDDKQKMLFTSACVACHSIAAVLRSKYNADELGTVIQRMRGYSASSINEPGDLVKPIIYDRSSSSPLSSSYVEPNREQAEYLSSINLSSRKDGKWGYELKSFPRPTGKSTKVIITEYDLPRREAQPHDVIVDRDGMIWSPDFGGPYLMQLNPRTGEVKEWKVPVEKPDFPAYGMGIAFDKSNNVWFTTMDQGGIAKLDRKTDKIKLWNVSTTPGNEKAHIDMLRISPIDGAIWFKDSQNAKVNRMNPETGHIDSYPTPVPFYGMSMNSKGNAYLPSMAKGVIGEIDVETGKVSVFPTPTPNSGARRGEFDRQGRFWFAEFNVGKIGMFDPGTRKFKEWEIPPMPWSGAYDAIPDKNGEVWSGGMHADYIFRLNPNTSEITKYLLPTLEANVRKVMVDNSTNPVTFWVGENHHAKIAKLEPLE